MEKISVLTQSKEDCLEAILVISVEKKWVRVRDLADYLGVKMSSVVMGIKFLTKKGLVNHEKYGYVELTRGGAQIAKQIYSRHKTLHKFLHDFLGLEEAIAWRDACQMEHVLDAKTIRRLLKFLKFIETYPEGKSLWLSDLRSFLKTGKRLESCLGGERQ